MDKRNFGYDASGNTLYDGNNRYWYDAEGQLCAVQNLRWQGGVTPHSLRDYAPFIAAR